MPLTRLQLRAIFARLKGLFRRVPKPISAISRKIWPEGRHHALVGRLPDRHKKLSNLQDVRLFSSEGQEYLQIGMNRFKADTVSGLYDHTKGVMYLNTSPRIYSLRVGYGGRPSHIPRPQFRVRGGQNQQSLKRIERNAKVGSVKSFYHEYGHSINNDYRFSNAPDWRRIVTSEWKVQAGETGYKISMDIPGGKVIPPSESWSESYSLYATSKASRVRLKRERPKSFDYMKKFFEEA